MHKTAFAILAVLLLSACEPIVQRQAVVVEVLTCTGPMSNALNGHHPGICRVEVDNGDRIDVRAPIVVGDHVGYSVDSNGRAFLVVKR